MTRKYNHFSHVNRAVSFYCNYHFNPNRMIETIDDAQRVWRELNGWGGAWCEGYVDSIQRTFVSRDFKALLALESESVGEPFSPELTALGIERILVKLRKRYKTLKPESLI